MNTPSTIAKSVAFCLACIFAAIVVIVALPGCASFQDGSSGGTPIGISIPIPPSGEHAGDLGWFKLGYEPNYLGTYDYAARAFHQEPKPTSTK
jgi:hypothetical protein